MAEELESPPGTTGITIGKVLAGTAMVAGAVLLAVTMFGVPSPTPSDPTKTSILQKLTDGIVSLFGKTNAATGEFVMESPGKVITGAGLVGGGYALYSAMNSKQDALEEARDDSILMGGRDDKWRSKVETGLIRGQMMARTALADPAYFGQMPPERG